MTTNTSERAKSIFECVDENRLAEAGAIAAELMMSKEELLVRMALSGATPPESQPSQSTQLCCGELLS
jgi:hypothetical protein